MAPKGAPQPKWKKKPNTFPSKSSHAKAPKILKRRSRARNNSPHLHSHSISQTESRLGKESTHTSAITAMTAYAIASPRKMRSCQYTEASIRRHQSMKPATAPCGNIARYGPNPDSIISHSNRGQMGRSWAQNDEGDAGEAAGRIAAGAAERKRREARSQMRRRSRKRTSARFATSSPPPSPPSHANLDGPSLVHVWDRPGGSSLVPGGYRSVLGQHRVCQLTPE